MKGAHATWILTNSHPSAGTFFHLASELTTDLLGVPVRGEKGSGAPALAYLGSFAPRRRAHPTASLRVAGNNPKPNSYCSGPLCDRCDHMLGNFFTE